MTRRIVPALLVVVSLAAATAFAQAPAGGGRGGRAAGPAQPPVEVPAEPLSALAPANLTKPRPKAPFDLTGNWFINGGVPGGGWLFGRTPAVLPKLTPAAQKHFDAYAAAAKDGKVYRDDIGKCWPAGMPVIMTRVWPIAMIQLPTAIYMISEFMNSLRVIYLDGRQHTDPDIVVRSFNGESIGRWEGDTLVVDIRHFRGDHHWMDQAGASIPAGEQFRVIERIRMLPGGKQLEIEFIMTDPEHWVGEWRSTKRFNRVNDTDIQEVSCLPDLNEHLKSTTSKTQVFQ